MKASSLGLLCGTNEDAEDLTGQRAPIASSRHDKDDDHDAHDDDDNADDDYAQDDDDQVVVRAAIEVHRPPWSSTNLSAQLQPKAYLSHGQSGSVIIIVIIVVIIIIIFVCTIISESEDIPRCMGCTIQRIYRICSL